jgi:molybdopterin converting factor subunit 1
VNFEVKLNVLYFATLRDKAGVREEQFEIASNATLADLKHQIIDRHPEIAQAMETSTYAVNRELAIDNQELQDGDEIALFPPVSGGSQTAPTIFRITREAIDMNGLLEELIQPTIGAACVFSGVVREATERGRTGETRYLSYDAYEPMAKAKMAQVADEIRQRWLSIEGIGIVQRIGDLKPGTNTVLIACTAVHRDPGVFEATQYGIDRLKWIVPTWRNEVGSQGEVWIEKDYLPGRDDRSRK